MSIYRAYDGIEWCNCFGNFLDRRLGIQDNDLNAAGFERLDFWFFCGLRTDECCDFLEDEG